MTPARAALALSTCVIDGFTRAVGFVVPENGPALVRQVRLDAVRGGRLVRFGSVESSSSRRTQATGSGQCGAGGRRATRCPHSSPAASDRPGVSCHYSSAAMASRKEQKEQLRREREEREAAAKEAAARKRRLIGYGAAGALVLAVHRGARGARWRAAATAASRPTVGSDVLPGRRQRARPEDDRPQRGRARPPAASSRASRPPAASTPRTWRSRSPTPTNPPTSGKHFEVPAEDGAYDEAPDVKELVHSLEHGRMIIWFKKNLPEDAAGQPQGRSSTRTPTRC